MILNIRTETVTFGIHKKRLFLKEEKSILAKIEQLDRELSKKSDQDIFDRLEACKLRLEEMRKSKMEGIIARSRAR